jgi:hypothetical protein
LILSARQQRSEAQGFLGCFSFILSYIATVSFSIHLPASSPTFHQQWRFRFMTLQLAS